MVRYAWREEDSTRGAFTVRYVNASPFLLLSRSVEAARVELNWEDANRGKGTALTEKRISLGE